MHCRLGKQLAGSEPDTFAEWVVWAFGRGIAEHYLLPYNQKIWRYPLNDVSSHWVPGKMPVPTLRDALRSSLQRDAVEEEMPHSRYYYPNRGGIQALVDAIAASCADGIVTDTVVERVRRDGEQWLINGEYAASCIVSTIPVDRLVRCFSDVPDQVMRAATGLKCNPLTTVLCRRAQPTGLSWLYLPSTEYFCHRIVFQGDLSPGCCPCDHSSATYEATCSASPDQILQNLREAPCPELDYDKVLGTSYTEYAYPVYDVAFEENIETVNAWLDTTGVRRCGRFAEWRYYNMDLCMKRAFAVVDSLLEGTKVATEV